MKKYIVSWEEVRTYSCQVEIEAASPEEALKKYEEGDYSEISDVTMIRLDTEISYLGVEENDDGSFKTKKKDC